ncbi:Chromosome (plasmid) partitioning protein ParB [hydrothermal vent metagenome]|uniref:Chromosome (Plasmid) partitioning protein ParB n=1 Tax=hydrothermal vent metagenome TaxID=652676 RepID=A0A3B0ZKR2_9ZZZZ
MAKKALGRNLGALLGGSAGKASSNSTESGVAKDGELRKLSIELIQPGKYQPRIDMHADSLDDLAESIRSQGIVQPIVVRPIEKPGHYEIIAGERRWRAAQIAGLHAIPALIRDVPDEAAIAMALIENIQRENLNPIEEAQALQRLIEEFEMTHQQAADAVGRSRASVSNLLRLLTLNSDVRKLLERGDLEMGHARALLSLQGDAQEQTAREVVAKALSVRETEQLVRRYASSRDKSTPATLVDPDIQRLQDQLSERLGAKVKFQHGAKGKGKVIIHYSNLDELDGILAHVK